MAGNYLPVCAHRKVILSGQGKTRCLSCGARFAHHTVDPATKPVQFSERWHGKAVRAIPD